MVAAMKKIVKLGQGLLSSEERNLLSVAYKNVIGARRASWRIISSLEMKDKASGDDKAELTKKYRIEVETELQKICDDILDLLDTHLIPSASTGGKTGIDAATAEPEVFYYKM